MPFSKGRRIGMPVQGLHSSPYLSLLSAIFLSTFCPLFLCLNQTHMVIWLEIIFVEWVRFFYFKNFYQKLMQEGKEKGSEKPCI